MSDTICTLTTFTISKPGQTHCFDIPLPRATTAVHGIETALRWQSGNWPQEAVTAHERLYTFQRNFRIGTLNIQNCGKPLLYHSTEVQHNLNAAFGDFAFAGFRPQVWSHGFKTAPEPVDIPSRSTLLKAIYQDKVALSTPYRYQISVYVWLTKTKSK